MLGNSKFMSKSRPETIPVKSRLLDRIPNNHANKNFIISTFTFTEHTYVFMLLNWKERIILQDFMISQSDATSHTKENKEEAYTLHFHERLRKQLLVTHSVLLSISTQNSTLSQIQGKKKISETTWKWMYVLLPLSLSQVTSALNCYFRK